MLGVPSQCSLVPNLVEVLDIFDDYLVRGPGKGEEEFKAGLGVPFLLKTEGVCRGGGCTHPKGKS